MRENQGVHRINLQEVSKETGMSPFKIPNTLYVLQAQGELSFDFDKESFVIKVKYIPCGKMMVIAN